MSDITDTGDAVSLDDLSITNYDVPVKVRVDAYDELKTLLDDVRTTAANTILSHVDEFWRDDTEARKHVMAKVELDEAHIQRELELGEADILRVETVTQLGSVAPEDDE